MIQANGVAARTQKLKVSTTEATGEGRQRQGCWVEQGVVATGTLFKVGIAKAISNPC